MEYAHITEAVFVRRINRFLAAVTLNGVEERVHVKNTGRLRELFVPGARVLLDRAEAPGRKTGYDLVSVYHGSTLVNVDSQAPNRIAAEYLSANMPGLTALKAEQVCGASRFDFRGEKDGQPFYLEVKGVTLVRDGIALFPDAPTERGLKHIRELTALKKSGVNAGVLFIIQRNDVRGFMPNRETQPAFAEALIRAREAGVRTDALDCLVLPGVVTARAPVPVLLGE